MAPRLQVLAGTSSDTMVPITSIVNTNQSHKFSSDLFEGEVITNIKGFADSDGRMKESEYFARGDRQGITWSIQVRGRFLNSHSADDILFGNTFDRPLKLPWGSGAALKFMNYIDPTLEHNLTSPSKPWALSPLISTMPHFMHSRAPLPQSQYLKPPPPSSTTKTHPASLPPFSPDVSVTDDTSQLHLAMVDSNSPAGSTDSSASSSSSSISSTLSSTHSYSSVTSASSKAKSGPITAGKMKQVLKAVKRKRKRGKSSSGSELHLETATQRRSYFSDRSHRQAVQFGPEDIITTDFCYGFLEFSPTLSLRIPGGLSFDLMRYWDGQPVRFVCCERKDVTVDGEEPWGRIFWCVSIEMGDDGHE